MRNYSAINHMLVRIPETFESKLKTKSGFYFLKDTHFAEVGDAVRSGIVVASPVDHIKEGDILFFHHNIAYEQKNYESQRVRSSFLIDGEDKVYYIPMDQNMIYAYERDGEFNAVDGYCFVKQDHIEHDSDLEYKEEDFRHVGTMVYSPNSMKAKGVMPGDRIVFKFNSEYIYRIYDEDLYRVRESSILARYE